VLVVGLVAVVGLNDLVDVSSDVLVFFITGSDDFLGSMLDHCQNLCCVNFLLFLRVMGELTSLHN
jgi:hypothetical protein